MTYAGLDVGSRTIKLVTRNGVHGDAITRETGANPLRRCQEMVSCLDFERLVVTGYGRLLAAQTIGGEVVSEIRAHAVGARHLYGNCRTVIDVGGQDCKVILLSEDGLVKKFEMNDRCAAGTGKFLEVMAHTLEVGIEDLGALALTAKKSIKVNSLCTVFAESEVISLIARGEETSAIALALHEAIATRIVNMVRRVGFKDRVVFTGGGALNPCLVRLIEDKLGIELTVPPAPQLTGALGAALLAERGSLKAG